MNYSLVLSCLRSHMHCQSLQATLQPTIGTGWMPYHERPLAAVSPTLRSTLQKSSTNLIVNSSPRSFILVIVYNTSSLQKPLHTAVIVLEKDNTPFNCPILNSYTVSSIDVYLNLDDCILHYSPMCSLNFVYIVHLILHFILCNWFCFITALNIVTACAWHARLKGYLSYLILSYLILF